MVRVNVVRSSTNRTGTKRTGGVRVNVVQGSTKKNAVGTKKKEVPKLTVQEEKALREYARIGEESRKTGRGFSRTEIQRRLGGGEGIRALRSASRKGYVIRTVQETVTVQDKPKVVEVVSPRDVSRTQETRRQIPTTGTATAAAMLSFDPLKSGKKLFFSEPTTRERLMMQSVEKLKTIKAPESQRIKAQEFAQDIEGSSLGKIFVSTKGKATGGKLSPETIREGFEKGADVLLKGTEKVTEKVPERFNPRIGITRTQAKEALADVLMFGAFTPLMSTATASQQSAYAEVVDPRTGQRRFILKSRVKDFLKARETTATKLTFAEKSSRANLLLRNLRNRDPKSLRKLEKLLEETYGKAFVKEWKMQEGLMAAPKTTTVVEIKPTVETPQLKAVSAVETVSVRVTGRTGSMSSVGIKSDVLTSPRIAQKPKQKSSQRSFLDIKSSSDVLSGQSTQTSTSTTTTQTTSQRSFFDFRPQQGQGTGGKGGGEPTPRTPERPPTKIRIPKLPKPFVVKTKKRLPTKKVKGYVPQVRDKGKWIKASKKVHTRAEALRIARRVADNTTAVTIRAKPSAKKPVKPKSKRPFTTKKFRDYRISKGKRVPLAKNTFIEKKSARIDTRGEKNKLSALAFLAKRRKRKL